MIKRAVVRRWCVCCALSAMGVSALAQDNDKEKTPPKADEAQPAMSEDMVAWMAAGTPGENHKLLEYAIGTWKVDSRFWMEPGAEPMTSTGTDKTAWILGGRYLETNFKGDFAGAPFEGRGFAGYDNINKRFFSVWMDSMSTFAMTEYGKYDSASKTFTYRGEFKDPKGQQLKSKSTIKIISKNEHVLTMYHQKSEGGEMRRVGELVYTRGESTLHADDTGDSVATAKP